MGSDPVFADDAHLMQFFTEEKTKLLTVFVNERKNGLSISEVSRQAGIARSTTYNHLKFLINHGSSEKHAKPVRIPGTSSTATARSQSVSTSSTD
ncbi:helix-turn-helix domain-containing protein (plasmid) [Haloarcula salina]|uniref:helix-turn-helix domain-containing protein n=1 Tax=Haloarcula salina TaxID=1429914 RepID=UPI003C6EAE38